MTLSSTAIREDAKYNYLLRKNLATSWNLGFMLIDYIVKLCTVTRNDQRILQGASPRAALSLTALAKATAWIQGRDFVLPSDIRFVFAEAIQHRLIWAQDNQSFRKQRAVVEELFASVRAPEMR